MSLFASLLLGTALAQSPPKLHAGEHALLFSLPVLNEGYDDSARSQTGLSDYVGVSPTRPAKAVVLYFFTKSSAGEDLGALNRLQKKLDGKGLQVIAIAVDDTPTGVIADWVSRQKLDFPVLSDQYHVVRDRYGITTTPMTWVVDGKGYIHSAGNPTGGSLESEVEAQVEPLIDAKD